MNAPKGTEVAKENNQELGLVQRGISMFLDVARFEFGKKVAAMLATSSMLPEQFRGPDGVANCMILLNLSDRMGVDPFMLAQNIYIVHGKPGIEAKLAIALHNGSGRFEPMEFEFKSSEGKEDWGCRATAKEIKSKKALHGSWITWKMVKAEGWLDKKGSKWKSMPEQMFMYRAAIFFVRTNSPETLLGLRTKDELDDMFIDVTPQESIERAERDIEENANKGEVVDIEEIAEEERKAKKAKRAETDEKADQEYEEYIAEHPEGDTQTVEERKENGQPTTFEPEF